MNKLGDRKMIILGTCILSCGIISLLIPTESSFVPLAGFIIIGFGCAPIYPCIIHSTPYNFGPENSGAIIGIQMASAYVGTTFIPPLFGVLGNLIGFNVFPVYLLVFVILMIPSLYKDTHVSTHDIFAICGVILNRRTSSTPQSSALQITKIFMVEIAESKRDKFCALQGT